MMDKKMNWQTLHKEVMALNRDLQAQNEMNAARAKRIRQILTDLSDAKPDFEPEMVETLKMLVAVIDSKFKNSDLKMELESVQNITEMVSRNELQMNGDYNAGYWQSGGDNNVPPTPL